MDAITLTPADVDDLTEHLGAISSRIPMHPIKTKRDSKTAVGALDALLDAGGADETHPLSTLVMLLGGLIGDSEDKQATSATVSPAEVLRFLMSEHGLNQSDLPEIGSQGVVSEILNGKRDLNVRQIRILSERFRVGAQIFV